MEWIRKRGKEERDEGRNKGKFRKEKGVKEGGRNGREMQEGKTDGETN